MANRDFECVKCGKVVEANMPPHVGLVCSVDRSVMVPIISLSKAQPCTDALFPFWHPNLGHKPVEVKGWGHFKQLLRDRGVSNPLGS
jgi:hypothetical protein